MSRPTDWSPLDLSGDPVPGDPAIVLAYGNKYADVADAIKRTAAKLHAISNHGDSEMSKYVDKLRDDAKEVADDIQKAHERYAGVAQAMQTYSTPLEQAQSIADAALIKARGASDQANHTATLHAHYENILQDPATSDADRTHYTLLQQQNDQARSEAHGILASAQNDLQHAIDMRNSAASTASEAIKQVESSGGINDSGWTKFWEHNGGWINDAITWLSVAAGVLAVIVMFIPIVGELEMLVIGIVVAAIVIANAIMQMTAGTKSLVAGFTEIGLALLPFGIGKLLGHFAAAAEPGIADAAAVTLRTSKAAQGIKGITQAKAATEVTESLADVKPNGVMVLLHGSQDATALARMNELAEMGLTKGGASERIAQLVEQANRPGELFDGAEHVWDATGMPDTVTHWVEDHTDSEPHEMAGYRSPEYAR